MPLPLIYHRSSQLDQIFHCWRTEYSIKIPSSLWCLSIAAIKKKSPCEEFRIRGEKSTLTPNNSKPVNNWRISNMILSHCSRATWLTVFWRWQGICCTKISSLWPRGLLSHTLRGEKVNPASREGHASLEIGQLCCRELSPLETGWMERPESRSVAPYIGPVSIRRAGFLLNGVM